LNTDRDNGSPGEHLSGPESPAGKTDAPGLRCVRFYEGLVEATWLSAIVITALFFNHLTYRSFEPDKAELLRFLALIAALAWGLRRLSASPIRRMPRHDSLIRAGDGGRWLRRLFRVPLLLPVLLLWLSMLLSTVLSVDWRVSLLGSYPRSQGLYTASAYLVIFLAVLALMRSRQQFDRLVTTLILTSIPVAVLGLMQHQGIDPIPWSDPRGTPVVSTMGNTIFVAAWLIMLAPLLLHRLSRALEVARQGLPNLAKLFASGFAVGLIGMLSVAWPRSLATAVADSLAGLVLLLSYAWAFRVRLLPWLQAWAYLVVLAAVIACILLTERRGPFLGLLAGVFLFFLLHLSIVGRWRAVLGMVGAAVLVLVSLISVPAVAPSLIEGTPFERLTRVLDTVGSAGVRLNVWQSVLDLSFSDPLRSIVGYGPDTLHLVVAPFSVPEIASGREGMADRAHSHTLDVLAGNGLLGVSAYAVFVIGLTMLGLRSAGLLCGAQGRRRFLISGALGILVFAGVVRWLDDAWRLLAIGLPAVLLFATVTAILAKASRKLRHERPMATGSSNSERQRWSATLFAALVAHLVEVHVGIATAATQTVFWIMTALLVAVTYRSARLNREGSAQQGSLLSMTLVVGLIIATLAFNFPLRHFAATHSASILWLFGLVAVLTGAIVLSDIWNTSAVVKPRSTRKVELGIYLSSVVLMFSVVGFAFSLSASQELPLMAPFWAFLAIGGALFVALAFSLASGLTIDSAIAERRWVPLIGAVLLVVVAALVMPLQQRPLHADALFKRGLMGHHRYGRYEEATHWFRRALALAPRQDHYHLHLGLALAAQAKRQGDAVSRDRLYGESMADIEEALRLRPRHPVYPEHLAHIHLEWGRASDDPDASTQRLRQAVEAFEQARVRNPHRPALWTNSGYAHTALGEHASASEKYRQAISLDGESPAARIALARSLQRQGLLDAAWRAYEQVIARQPDAGAAYVELIRLHLQRADCANAKAVLSTASTVLPDGLAIQEVAQDVDELCSR